MWKGCRGREDVNVKHVKKIKDVKSAEKPTAHEKEPSASAEGS
jgi:hypothetical protein